MLNYQRVNHQKTLNIMIQWSSENIIPLSSASNFPSSAAATSQRTWENWRQCHGVPWAVAWQISHELEPDQIWITTNNDYNSWCPLMWNDISIYLWFILFCWALNLPYLPPKKIYPTMSFDAIASCRVRLKWLPHLCPHRFATWWSDRNFRLGISSLGSKHLQHVLDPPLHVAPLVWKQRHGKKTKKREYMQHSPKK